MFPQGSTAIPTRIFIDLAVHPDGTVTMAGPPVLTSQIRIPGVPGLITQSDPIVDTDTADGAAMASLVHVAVTGVFAANGVALKVPPAPLTTPSP